MTFLYNGAVDYDEPGVFIAFEEQPEELIKNVGSLRYDLQKLIDQKKLAIDYVHIDPSQIDEAGDYDLEGLFLRLGFAIDSERKRRDCDRHRRAGRRHADALWTRRVRRRLRHPAR
jgi:circadian clock protein KaiC